MKRRTLSGYIMLVPALLLIGILILFPTLKTIATSFFEYRTQTAALGMKWVGLKNYIDILHDEFFGQTFIWTIVFTFLSVGIELILGMIIALLMNRKIPGQGIIRTSILIPWAMPAVVAGIIWRQVFSLEGFINSVFKTIGLNGYQWLGKAFSAKSAVLIADIWKNTPYMSLLLLAGLLTINHEYYEAAIIDGANKWRQFWSITIPLIKPTMMVTILFRIISAMRIYDLIVAMTEGGPGGVTTTVSMYTISTYFTYGNIGYGSAMSVVLLIISIIISLFFLDSLQSRLK